MKLAEPIICPLPLAADALVGALLKLAPARRVHVLDSCGARGADARYLIAGFDPFEQTEARGRELLIERRGTGQTRVERGAAFSYLDGRLAELRAAGLPQLPVAGACVATLSYDLVRCFERLRGSAGQPRVLIEPDATFAFFDTLIVHDYARGESFVVSVAGPERLAETSAALEEAARHAKRNDWEDESEQSSAMPYAQAPTGAAASLFGSRVASNFTRDEYLTAARRIKEHIFAGDIYQANLTQQLVCPLARGLRPEEIFRRLRRDHPASFGAFIRRREDTVISASPERFLRVRMEADGERRVEAWPIKGTRPRGQDAAEDARLRAELLASEKDRAENIMIVDLLRNDLGRVCRFGSVEVAEICALQEHPTLFHLVSQVRGRLREEVTAGSLLRASFPCGSITGAPKIRAMEILDEIETIPRGLSMGAIGYFSFDGALDLSVAIRTMTVRAGVARFNVGGGIVADSDPAQEYEESLVKARALLRALGVDVDALRD